MIEVMNSQFETMGFARMVLRYVQKQIMPSIFVRSNANLQTIMPLLSWILPWCEACRKLLAFLSIHAYAIFINKSDNEIKFIDNRDNSYQYTFQQNYDTSNANKFQIQLASFWGISQPHHNSPAYLITIALILCRGYCIMIACWLCVWKYVALLTLTNLFEKDIPTIRILSNLFLWRKMKNVFRWKRVMDHNLLENFFQR